MTIVLMIPGTPYAKKSDRITTGGGKARAFNPAENERFEAVVRQLAALQLRRPLLGPVRVEIAAVFAPPPSWSKKKRAAHLWRAHTQKPDLDNLAKAVLDGLNRVAFGDDSQVVDLRTRKLWGEPAQTKVTIEPMTGEGMSALLDQEAEA